MSTKPNTDTIVFPTRMELRIFANANGGITFEQDDHMQGDPSMIVIDMRDVDHVIAFLRKAKKEAKAHK